MDAKYGAFWLNRIEKRRRPCGRAVVFLYRSRVDGMTRSLGP
jgi:hypothetical protein